MNGLRTAIGFLTRIPVDVPDPRMAAAAPWFPVVGLAIGAAQAAVLLGATRVLPPWPAAVLAVAAATLITGAFHHDGLADMADAFGGGWDVDQRLAILGDSRLGTYGTSALILAFATELSVLASLEPTEGAVAVIAAHALSRSVAVGAMLWAPMAGDGMGAAYASDLRPAGAAVAMAFGVMVAVVAFAGTWHAVPALLSAIVVAALVVALAVAKIGGVTGDVLGAIQQLSALAILLVAATAA